MGLYVFRVEDGEIHHVVAAHPSEAIDTLAASLSMTRAEYLEEIGDHEIKRLEPFDSVMVRVDDLRVHADDAKGLPQHHVLHVQALCKDWIAADPRPHVLCSSAN